MSAQVEGWEKRVEGREDAADVRDAATALKKTPPTSRRN
jgi:hypothetical protein